MIAPRPGRQGPQQREESAWHGCWLVKSAAREHGCRCATPWCSAHAQLRRLPCSLHALPVSVMHTPQTEKASPAAERKQFEGFGLGASCAQVAAGPLGSRTRLPRVLRVPVCQCHTYRNRACASFSRRLQGPPQLLNTGRLAAAGMALLHSRPGYLPVLLALLSLAISLATSPAFGRRPCRAFQSADRAYAACPSSLRFPSSGIGAASSRTGFSPLPPPVPPAAKALSPLCCAGQTCIGTAGTYSNRGTTFMDGADDVTQIDVPDVAAAMESCCSLCSSRDDPDIGHCQAWDAFPAGDNAWLCQVGGHGRGGSVAKRRPVDQACSRRSGGAHANRHMR